MYYHQLVFKLFQETSITCPRTTDITFSNVFTYQYHRSDLNPKALERTISDLCWLASWRCNSDEDCWFGRKCCPVNSWDDDKCKLCIFDKWKYVWELNYGRVLSGLKYEKKLQFNPTCTNSHFLSVQLFHFWSTVIIKQLKIIYFRLVVEIFLSF